VDSIDDFLKDDIVVVEENQDNSINMDNIQKKNTNFFENTTKKVLNVLSYENKKEIYFILGHSLVFLLINIHDITFIKIILFSFFTFQIIILSKIIINTHYLNIKNINNIKKQLNSLGDIV
jgi:hypothetical protein